MDIISHSSDLEAKPSSTLKAKQLSLRGLLDQLVEDGRLLTEQRDKVLINPRPRAAQSSPLTLIAEFELIDQLSGKVLNETRLCQWLAERESLPFYHIDPLKIDVVAITQQISYAYAERHNILVVEVLPEELRVACADPYQQDWQAGLEQVSRRKLSTVLASPADLQRYRVEFYRVARSVSGASSQADANRGFSVSNFEQLLDIKHLKSPDADDEHIVNIVDWLLGYAFSQRASDIHLEPRRDQGIVRFRIDGVLHQIYELPSQVMTAVVSRLKILGRMNVAEKRKPQDGRLKTRNPEGNEVELRLSTLPTAFGEKLVQRIFDPDVLVKNFAELGFSREDNQRWQGLTRHTHGIIFVTGPTGSGKTTTLYSTLKQLATPEVNVCTIEDPIEMVEPAFNQVQVQPNIDVTFSSGVRALLRQDPDIIMIGEIRDLETAEMAVQAALTGHLVLSTLHTNDAPTAITRLLELGLPAYLIKATLLGVMAQRLVRTLCPHCATPAPMNPEQWQLLTQPWNATMPETIKQPEGCLECRNTGYLGRCGVYEIFPLSDTLKDLMHDDMDLLRFRRQAVKEGMRSLRLSGAQKVAQGLTTVEEVLRVTPEHGL